jgi:hypothetical protein
MAATGKSDETTDSKADAAGSGDGPGSGLPQNDVWTPLLRWLLFSVLIAVLPIGFNGIFMVNRSEPLVWKSLLAHGELYLISVAVTAAALGEMFGREGGKKLTRMCLTGLSCILIAISSVLFADTASIARQAEGQMNIDFVAWGSITFFVFSVVTGACCIVVSELRGAGS